MTKGRILIVDDEVTLLLTLSKVLTSRGYEVHTCSNGNNFLSMLAQHHPDIVLLDIYMGEYNGLELISRMKETGFIASVIMITAFPEVSLAVKAMKEGASDFLTKPIDINHLFIVIEKNLEHARLARKITLLENEVDMEYHISGIISKSEKMQRVLKLAEKLSQSDNTTVLIEGETGTGKELLARYIFSKSVRKEMPFIKVNCGAIPRELAESELFGYEKGAFTGADKKMKQGKFELADKGTILLDEIGELSLEIQVKLLRILEDRKFYRLGGTKEIDVDVRVIAATNRDLEREVAVGNFREDLFYRINVMQIKIPPLRERLEDILPLAKYFLQDFSSKFNKADNKISADAIKLLEQQYWKGNVRELRNVIERTVLLSDADVLQPTHFNFIKPSQSLPGTTAGNSQKYNLNLPQGGIGMNEVIKDLILKTLILTNGNQVQAAKILRISRSKFRYRLQQLGIALTHDVNLNIPDEES